jgi:hypothetical protein
MNTRHYSEFVRGRKGYFFGAESFSILFFTARSVSPKITKPERRELRVTYRVSNVLVAQVMLDGARVVSFVGQLVTCSVTKHVRVHGEWKPCVLARSTHDLANCRITQRPASFAHEYVREVAGVAFEPTQRANLNAT